MSSSNGTITLKSFAELAQHLDVDSLPAGPADDAPDIQNELSIGSNVSNKLASIVQDTPRVSLTRDLASVLAQLADVTAGLEAASRQDACAREQATIELARYEILAAEQEEAQRALVEARRVRTTAEVLSRQAFTQHARAEAVRALALSRQAELSCAELMAERTRAADELASRPHLAAMLADRRQREQDQVQAERRAEEEQSARLSRGIAAAREALRDNSPDQAVRILAPLAGDFPSNDELQRVMDIVRWQKQQLIVGPAQTVLRDLRDLRDGRYRDNPEQAVLRLSGVTVDGLPADLARQLFGVWSNACYQLVQRRGWHLPVRHSPQMSRGAILARRVPKGPAEIVSALGMAADWRVGEIVTDVDILHACRPLLPR
jgi:hypothetical protein